MKFFLDISILKRNKNFRALYMGQSVSFIGSMITMVALPYQIYHLTNSTLMIGVLSFCQLIPLLITALLGGVLADRHQRKKLLLGAECFLSLGCLLLAFNSHLAKPHVWFIILVASLMSALNGIHRPAFDSIKQQIVAREDFPAIGALTGLIFNVGMIVAPAIGGLLISGFGVITTYLIDFCTFIFSLSCLLMIDNYPRPLQTRDESTWSALRSGVRYSLSRQELIGTYLVDFIAMIFGMPNALFPAIAQSYGGVKTLGMLYSAPALGALIMSSCSGWVKHVKHHGIAIALAATAWGIAIIFFGLAHNLYVALFFLMLAGAADDISAIFRQTMWNETIPFELRGRLAGIEMISYLSGPRLGDTEASLVAAAFGITASIISGGALCVIGVAICCYTLPKFWKYKSS